MTKPPRRAGGDSLGDFEKQRQYILDYQEKLDDARERSNADDFTKEELDKLDADLEASLPEAVARQMPGFVPEVGTRLSGEAGLGVDGGGLSVKAISAESNISMKP